jgi:hypothetical protein
MSKQFQVLGLLAGYVLVMGMLSIYHAYNFSDYVHWKGDETIYYTLFLLVTSVVFQAIVWLMMKKIFWKATLLATIVNFFLSFIIGFAILIISGLSGIPRHIIFIYGGWYLMFFTMVTVLQSFRTNEE